MKRALLSGLLLAGMLSAPVYAQAMEKSLYERLGGYDAISAVVNELAVMLVTDKKLGVYFKELSNDSKRKLIAHLTDFVCSATGGGIKAFKGIGEGGLPGDRKGRNKNTKTHPLA